MEHRWNDTDGETLKYGEKPPLQCHFFHHIAGLNMEPGDEMPATNLLSRGNQGGIKEIGPLVVWEVADLVNHAREPSFFQCGVW